MTYKFNLTIKQNEESEFSLSTDLPLPIPRIGEKINFTNGIFEVKNVEYKFIRLENEDGATEDMLIEATVFL